MNKCRIKILPNSSTTLWKSMEGFRKLIDRSRQPKMLHLHHRLVEVGVVQGVELREVVDVVLHPLFHLPVEEVIFQYHLPLLQSVS